MKLSIRYILLVSIILLAATACEEIIELEGEYVEPKMIIQSVCTNEDKIVIAISSSGTIYDTPDTGEVFNPIVKVSINGSEPKECTREVGASPYKTHVSSSIMKSIDYPLKETYKNGMEGKVYETTVPVKFPYTFVSEDTYEPLFTFNYRPKEGDVIDIIVEDLKSGTTVKATTQIPRRVEFDVKILEIDSTDLNLYMPYSITNMSATIECTIHDPANISNYYVLEYLDRSYYLVYFFDALPYIDKPEYPFWYKTFQTYPISTRDQIFYDPNITTSVIYESELMGQRWYVESEPLRSFYFNDETFDGKSYSLILKISTDFHGLDGASVPWHTGMIDGLFKLHSMSEEMYRYCKSKEYSQQYNQDIFSQPNQLYSNIKGDAYGFHISESYSYSEPIMIGFEEIAGYFE